VLYGERRGDVVRIMASKELPCEHANGPAFGLSANDQHAFRELMKAPSGMRTVGWYCSHTRSGLALNTNDCAILERFFGERGNVTLIVKPTRFGPVEATFYVQGSADAGPHFSVLVPKGAETARPELAPPPVPVTAAPGWRMPNIQLPAWTSGTFRWAWLGIALIATGLLLMSMRSTARPARVAEKLGLQAFQIADGQVHVEWNRQAPAIGEAKSGTLEITDGAYKYSMPLTAEDLRSSSLTYGRRSDAMTVKLRLANGAEEVVHLVAPPEFPASPAQVARATPVAEALEPDANRIVERAAAPGPEKESKKRETEPPAGSASPAALKQFVPPPVRGMEEAAARLPEPPPVVGPAIHAAALAIPTGTPAPPVLHLVRSGRLIWSGSFTKRAVLEIDGSKSSMGSMSGGLPKAAAKLKVYPAESAKDGLTVYVTEAARHNKTEGPGAATEWNRLHFIWDPERVKQIQVTEAPAASNQFSKLVVRNEGRTCTAIVIEWTVD
jgi:hypothetical protein